MKNEMKLKKWQVMGIGLLFCVCASLIFEYTQFEDVQLLLNAQTDKTLDLDSFENKGYEIEDGCYTSITEDPGISGEVNTYVENLTFQFTKELSEDMNIKVYYTTKTEGFCEENSRTVDVKAGATDAEILVEANTLRLRIDLGDKSGASFELGEIIVNNSMVLEQENNHFVADSIVRLMTRMIVEIFVLGFIFANFILDRKKMYEGIYRFRFIIGICVVAYCTIFELSGSSIGFLSGDLGSVNNIVFGKARSLRTDEYALNTMMAMSQCNTENPFSYFSDAFRGSATDMFMVYGQPVWCLGVLFRPFQWGYLLFGASRGLAFFWSARQVVLVLVSFEFGMLLSKKNKNVSFIYAILMGFSAQIQWWYAVNGLVEMLVWSQLAIIMLCQYIYAKSYKKKALYAAVIAECAGGYLLVLYPAWQIPIAYILLGCIIWVFWENWKEIHVKKWDILIVTSIFVVWLAIIATVFYTSWDTIQTVMGTEYPGSRSVSGGTLENLKKLFVYPATIFYPFTEVNIPLNVCEMAVMYDFFPLGLLLSLYVLRKKKDKLLIVTLVINTILALWCFLPWPGLLAKISLLSMSQPGRSILALQIGNMILLIRSVGLLGNRAFSKRKTLVASVLLTVATVIVANNTMGDYLTSAMLAGVIAVVFLGFYFILQYGRMKYALTVLCIVVMAVSGMYVNPVQHGIDVVTESDLIRTVTEVDENESGIWIADLNMRYRNTLSAMGLSVLNSTNVYPNVELWKKVDPDGEYEKVYNRYAWIGVTFKNEGATDFELTFVDSFVVNINILDLEKLDISYIVTETDLTELNCEEVTFELVATTGNKNIYQVKYQ